MLVEDRKEKITTFKVGDHAVCIYENQEEHKDLLVSYIKHGIERNEKVITIEYSLSEDVLRYELIKAGLDVNILVNTGQLKILTHEDTYLRDGYFDINRQIKFWQNEMELALKEGYSALRVTGEASWLTDAPLGSELFMKYESQINDIIDDNNCIVLCRYDIKSLTPETFSEAIANHPKILMGIKEFDNDDYYLLNDFFKNREKKKRVKIKNWIKKLKSNFKNRIDLENREKTYSLLYSAVQEGVCIHKLVYNESEKAIDYEILDVNPAYEAITGLNKENIIGRKASEIYNTENPPYIEIYSKVTLTGKPTTFETYFESMKKYLHISAVCLAGKGEFAIIFSDITERVRLQKELKNAKQTAELANSTKSDYLANMSHEVRTPLNAIIGFSDILLTGMYGQLNDKGHQYLKNISISGKHLLNLVNDLLDISKIEAGKIELMYEDLNSHLLIQEIVSGLKPLAVQKNVSINFELENIGIKADSKRLKQILYNLLSNAIKFTPEGGRILVKSDINDSNLVVLVEDTGIGIAKEDHDKIFQQFKQIDSSYSRTQEGTGLGLALTKKLVELHNGSIHFESEKDRGSRFWFILPKATTDYIVLN